MMLYKALDLVSLTKPKVLLLMLSTSYVGLVLSQQDWPSVVSVLGLCFGIFGVGGSGAVLNHIFDRMIDIKMSRTKQRPIAQERVSITEASFWAFFLMIIGSFILLYTTNVRTCFLTICGSFGYGIIYTRFLKFVTPQNIAIGGLSGALPPLLGWSAGNPDLGAMSWILVSIIFVWTPPHFWALCLSRKNEYALASVPMLPVTHGERFTALFILLYSILLIPLCFIPWLIGFLSWKYAVLSLGLNIYYLCLNFNILLRQHKSCERSFIFSIFYLYILFAVMLLDRKGFL